MCNILGYIVKKKEKKSIHHNKSNITVYDTLITSENIVSFYVADILYFLCISKLNTFCRRSGFFFFRIYLTVKIINFGQWS